MDVERAVEHMLALHARAEARMDRADARMDRAEARMDRLEKQAAKTWKLMQAGAKVLVDIGKAQKRFQKDTDYKLNALIAAQTATDQRLARLIQTLQASGDGRGPQ